MTRWYIAALVLAVGLLIYAVLAFDIEEAFGDPIDDAVAAIIADEGFRGQPYKDTRGLWTVGYGTRLPLTPPEGALLLRHRLGPAVQCFADGWSGWEGASDATRAALADAVYANGCEGLLAYHDALGALQRGDLGGAAVAFRDSIWYGEEPHRVERVIRTFGG